MIKDTAIVNSRKLLSVVSEPSFSLMFKIQLSACVEGLHEIVRLHCNFKRDDKLMLSSSEMIDDIHAMHEGRKLPKISSRDEFIKVSVNTINDTIELQCLVAHATQLPRETRQVSGAIKIPWRALEVTAVQNDYLTFDTTASRKTYLAVEVQELVLDAQRYEVKLKAQMEEQIRL